MFQFDNTAITELDPLLARISFDLDEHQSQIREHIKNQFDYTWGKGHKLTLSSAIRISIFQNIRGMNYRDLSIATKTDLSLRMFAGIADKEKISKSTLQDAISTIPLEIIELTNRLICQKHEDLSKVRIDSTGVSANVALPENNALLYQAIRRGQRLMDSIEDKMGIAVFSYSIDAASAKRLSYDIRFETKDSKNKDKKYQTLLFSAGHLQDIAPAIIDEANNAIKGIEDTKKAKVVAKLVREFQLLIDKLSCVIYQTISWMQGENLQASDKLFSVAKDMEHVDIIIKDNRKIVYGHKIDVVEGPKGLITHLVVHSGNPNDSSTLISTVTHLEKIFGVNIDTLVTDGGYNSKSNLAELKQKGIKESVFTRKRALTLGDMGVSEERYQELKNWRSGIERGIGRLKKKFGFARVVCTTIERFRLYLWIGVLAANVSTIAAKPKVFSL
jgi:IS5 family transposase